jgi:hypothetical protein
MLILNLLVQSHLKTNHQLTHGVLINLSENGIPFWVSSELFIPPIPPT